MAHLDVHSVHKTYGSVQAVRGVSLSVRPGEIHALVGENGAGKSTLLKIAAGHIPSDAGAVTIDGAPLLPHTPHEALARGVALVAQHFTLVGPFTVLENIVLGHEPIRHGVLDKAAARESIARLERQLGMTFDLDARTDTLGVGSRQRIEIARALYRGSRTLLLDEPTAVLAKGEADALYAMLQRLKADGFAIVVTTHKLDEVLDYADVTTVMRRGEIVSSTRKGEGADSTTSTAGRREELTRAIMGGEPPRPVTRRSSASEKRVLELSDVTVAGALHAISFNVHAGEVVGIAGIEGNGQRELTLLLAGLLASDAGSIRIGNAPGDRAAVVHEDRQREGLVLSASVSENLMLGELEAYTSFGLVSDERLSAEARKRHEKAGIHPPDLEIRAAALSGGNQQKIVVARALAATAAPLLVLSHPTRGVDVGAAHAIHESIAEAVSRGKGVVLTSSDLAELRALSDRILVIAHGSIVGEFTPDADDVTLGHAMLMGAA